MQKAQQDIKRKFKLVHPKSKSQKKYETITRCQTKDTPRVKRKAVSLYKIDYTKEYALPLNRNEENKFQFWGCAHPPKKIKVRNPFLSEEKGKDRLLAGQGINLFQNYLVRKFNQEKKTAVINPQHKSSSYLPYAQDLSQQKRSTKNIQIKNSRTLQILSPKSKQFDTHFFMSTMITDCEDSLGQIPTQKFRPLKETIFMQKMHELKQRISKKNNLLGQIKSNMNTIRLKKMNMLELF